METASDLALIYGEDAHVCNRKRLGLNRKIRAVFSNHDIFASSTAPQIDSMPMKTVLVDAANPEKQPASQASQTCHA
jgi:hypothetical protein